MGINKFIYFLKLFLLKSSKFDNFVQIPLNREPNDRGPAHAGLPAATYWDHMGPTVHYHYQCTGTHLAHTSWHVLLNPAHTWLSGSATSRLKWPKPELIELIYLFNLCIWRGVPIVLSWVGLWGPTLESLGNRIKYVKEKKYWNTI